MSEYRFSAFKFFRNIVFGTLLIGFAFGVVGYLLSGAIGFFNMIPIGLIIGFFGSLVLGYAIYVKKHSYGGPLEGTNVKILGEWWWFIKQSNVNGKKSDH